MITVHSNLHVVSQLLCQRFFVNNPALRGQPCLVDLCELNASNINPFVKTKAEDNFF